MSVAPGPLKDHMYLAVSLAIGLLSNFTSEKTNFVHKFEEGKTSTFEFNVTGSQSQGDVSIKALIDMQYGAKVEKGTSLVLKAKELTMEFNGNSMNAAENMADQKFVLDETGMPDQIEMSDASAVIAMTMILAYLPAKELEVGQTFEINKTVGDVVYKGSGTYAGDEEQGGHAVAKLKVKATLGKTGEEDVPLEYVLLYDSGTNHVVKVDGTAEIEGGNFKFSLMRK